MEEDIKDKVDKNTPESVLVGFDGSVQSLVAAFLLQKQVHKVSVLVLELWSDELFSPLKCPESLKIKAQDIKEIAEKLDFSLYAVNAVGLYSEHILEEIMAARVLGHYYDEYFHLNALVLKVLEEKRKLLGIDYIATGHLAKITSHRKTGRALIHSSIDQENDQSAYLAGASQSSLEKLILPLSEVKKQDVRKIADRFNLPYVDKFNVKYSGIYDASEIVEYIESKVPEKFLASGSVYNYDTNINQGEHHGFHRYLRGENRLSERGLSSTIEHKYKISDMDFKNNTITISQKNPFKFDSCIVKAMPGTFEVSSRPVNAHCFHLRSKEMLECSLFFRPLEVVLVEFKRSIDDLFSGDVLVFYVDTSRNYKVIGSGVVKETFPKGYEDPFDYIKSEEEVKERKELIEKSFFF